MPGVGAMGDNGGMSDAPSGSSVLDEQQRTRVEKDQPWVCIVWDDPVNLMSYVTHVFCTYFHYPKPKAERLMLQVHTQGKSVVSSGGREQIERDVDAMHSFGLWATLDKAD